MTSPTTPTTPTTGGSTGTSGTTGATKVSEPEKATATTETVAAKVDAAEDVAAPAEKVVRYKLAGAGKVKRITKEDFESIKINGQDGVEFNVINDFTLPATDFTAEALRYCDKVDPNLEVVDKPKPATED